MTDQLNLALISEADLAEQWFALRNKTWRLVTAAVKSCGVEQKKLADRIGMNPSQFNRAINGRMANLTLRTLYNIARAAGYRLKITLEPLSSLRKPSSSFESERGSRLEQSNKIVETTAPRLSSSGWTRAESNSRLLEPVE